MENITKTKLISNIIKFQTKIRKNLQLYCFSSDAIINFSNYHKSNFKNYEFVNFGKKFKNISIKDTSDVREIEHGKIVEYGHELVEKELSNLVFVLNMADFEAWLVEFLDIIFSSDHGLLLKYLKPEETPINLSLLEQSSDLEEVWQRIIGQYLLNKSYDRKNKILKILLASCNIKENKDFEEIEEKISENFLCRNLVIHNKNIVDKEYLLRAGKRKRCVKEGEIIEITQNCLFEQGENLLLFMKKVRDGLGV